MSETQILTWMGSVYIVVACIIAGIVWDTDIERSVADKMFFGLLWPVLPLISLGRLIARIYRR